MKCSDVFEKIDDLTKKYLDILEDVCNIESPTNFKEGVDAVGKYFLNLAKTCGYETEIFEQSKVGDVVCITLNPEINKPPLTLSGHMDTVYPVGMFSCPAVRRDEKNMYGPGTLDCKGGIVAAALAMHALRLCGYKKRPVRLLLQSDEENGSMLSNKATINYICDKASDSAAFLNLEGYENGTAIVSSKGILRYIIRIRGKSVHSSICHEGANAVAEAAHKILQLEKMKNAHGLTCNCGVINGGTKPNVVADSCEFSADIRFLTYGEADEARQKIKTISDISYINGCTCEVKEISYRPPMMEMPANMELLNKMNKACAENGLPVLKGRLFLAGTDAAYVTERGIACIDGLGTEGKNMHSPDEYISLSSLAASAKRIAALAYNL